MHTTLHVAPNGQVFHSGPTPRMHYIDPTGNGSFQQVGPEMTDFYHKHGTTIMYAEGKLLTAGGWVNGSNVASTNKAFTIDLNGPSPVVAATAFAQELADPARVAVEIELHNILLSAEPIDDWEAAVARTV